MADILVKTAIDSIGALLNGEEYSRKEFTVGNESATIVQFLYDKYIDCDVNTAWLAWSGTKVAQSERICTSEMIELTDDILSARSNNNFVIFGNNEGYGHALTQVTESFVKSFDFTNFAYKYFCATIVYTGEGETVSDVFKLTKHKKDNKISVTNNDNYSHVNLFINGSETACKLNPRSVCSLDHVKSLSMQTELGLVNVTIEKGIAKGDKEYIPEVSFREMKVGANNYFPLDARRKTVLAAISKNVYVSTDSGVTYTLKSSIAGITGVESNDYITKGRISLWDDSKIIIFTHNGLVLVSTNSGNSWTLCDLSAYSSEYAILPPFYNDYLWIGDVILFGEYGVTQNRPYRVFRSNDNGATWNVVLSKNNLSEIRHWHNMDYMIYSNKIILTSGDENNNVRWFVSADRGETWSEVEDINNKIYSQRYRTLRIMEVSYNKIMWGADSVSKISEICIADLDNIVETTEVLTDLNKTIFGIQKNGQDILAITCTEETDYQDGLATIYISRDNGKSFKRCLETKVLHGAAGGFRACLGINENGEYLVHVAKIDGKSDYNSAIWVKPN